MQETSKTSYSMKITIVANIEAENFMKAYRKAVRRAHALRDLLDNTPLLEDDPEFGTEILHPHIEMVEMNDSDGGQAVLRMVRDHH